MKKLIYTLIVVFICSVSYSQSGWTPLPTGLSEYMTSVHFYTEMYGMAVSNTGTIIKTISGGINWSQAYANTSINFNDIRIINATNACAAGRQISNSNLEIFRTTNAGLNWVSVHVFSQSGYTFNNMKFYGDTGLVSFNNGLRGSALKTINGGLNWTYVAGPSIGLHQDYSFISSTVYFVFCYEEIFVPNPYPPHYEYKQYSWRTTDGGGGWQGTLYDVLINSNTGLKAYFYDVNTGYIFRSAGGSRMTTNGGQSWYGTGLNQMSSISSAFLVSGSNLFLTGVSTSSNPVVAKSTNSGINWVYNNFPNTVNKIFFLNQNTGWVASANGIIYKTTNGGLVFVNNISSELPSSYSLSQNYPNPFNPVTKIRFSIVSSPHVSGGDLVLLKVYDITGREVQTLVNERLQPGTYETSFDGSTLNTGVYFYKLVTEGFTETKKMLLIK